MSLSFLDSLIFFGALQGIGLSARLFFTHRFNCLANKMLSGFILCFSLLIIRNITETQGLLNSFSYLAIIANALIPLIGPFIYLYVCYLIQNNQKVSRASYRHFIFAIVYFFVITVAALFGITTDKEIAQIPWLTLTAAIIQLAVALQFLCYLVLTIRKITSYNLWLKNHCSTLDKQSLLWLKLLLICITTMFLTWLILFGADIKILSIKRSNMVLELFWLTYSILIYWIGYYSLLNPNVFLPKELTDNIDNNKTERYFTSEKLEQLLMKLNAHMETNRPHLNAALTLKQLANQLEISSKELSLVINLGRNKTFFDFVNTYRIEEIKKILQDGNKRGQKIEVIAYESGIKSTSTLNRLFKKHVNMTPSQYRAQFNQPLNFKLKI
jgi:AraC-like DNA-binding protein